MSLRFLHYSDVENAHDDPERIGRLAGALRELADDGTVVAGSGDNTSPGVLPLVTEGMQAVDFFEAAGTDVETFGNHDFDYGIEATRRVVAASPQTWVSANVRDDGERFAADEGVVPWFVIERAGTRVGVTGVTDPKTPSINPNAGTVTFENPIEAVREAAAELRDAGAEYVVVLSHLGNGDQELAVETDVDVVLGGHVHTELQERIEGTLLTRPGVNGEVVYEVELGDDPAVTRHRVADFGVNESVAGALRERESDAALDEVVAHVTDPIERSEATTFRGESRIGNFVADAYRWAGDADVGLQNSGGIRSGPDLAGDVTVSDLVSVVPFDEPVAVAELTGEELRTVLRQSHGATVGFGEADWWHSHVSGVELVWDTTREELVEVTVDGDPLDPDATYTMATNDYLFHTDHEFPLLDHDHRTGTLDTQYEVLAAYAREFGIDPAVEGRIRRRPTKEA